MNTSVDSHQDADLNLELAESNFIRHVATGSSQSDFNLSVDVPSGTSNDKLSDADSLVDFSELEAFDTGCSEPDPSINGEEHHSELIQAQLAVSLGKQEDLTPERTDTELHTHSAPPRPAIGAFPFPRLDTRDTSLVPLAVRNLRQRSSRHMKSCSRARSSSQTPDRFIPQRSSLQSPHDSFESAAICRA